MDKANLEILNNHFIIVKLKLTSLTIKLNLKFHRSRKINLKSNTILHKLKENLITENNFKDRTKFNWKFQRLI